LYNNIS